MTTVENQLCRADPTKQDFRQKTQVPAQSLGEEAVGAFTRSDAVRQVLWLWGVPGGAGQGQPPPVPCQMLLSMRYETICRWLLLVLGLEVPRRAQL